MIEARLLPENALLRRHASPANYTDCLIVEVDRVVSLHDLIIAFFSSAAFWPERQVLTRLLGHRGADHDLEALASGAEGHFAAWSVEARTDDQILLCDFQHATRTWLMIEPCGSGRTRLLFGTAVVLSGREGLRRAAGKALFYGLLWFHKPYARLLLRGAVDRIHEQNDLPDSSR